MSNGRNYKSELEEKYPDFEFTFLGPGEKGNEEVVVKCKNCGKTKTRFISSVLNYCGCQDCSSEKKRKKDFIEEAIKKYGDYIDYSETVYVNKRTEITYFCTNCGEYHTQLPLIHLKRGCKKCNKKDPERERTGHIPKTTEQFIEDARKVQGKKYDYSLVNYVNKYSMLDIICPIHGVFKQMARIHLAGCGCKACHETKGETRIRAFLDNHNIEFTPQKTFDDLRDSSTSFLRYDFYVPEYNLLIEYSGQQHYDPASFHQTHEKFLKQKHHDWMKRKYAKNKGIDFLTIPYWDYKNIDKILTERLDLSRLCEEETHRRLR